ncbi:MAG: SprB repeat-containing protein [Saprospiraceae bacterium]
MKQGLLNQSIGSSSRLRLLMVWAISLLLLPATQAMDFCGIQPNASHTTATCFGGSNGSASVSPTGGTAPYSVSWSNGASGFSIAGLSAGNYQYTITDATGCSMSSNIYVGQPALIQANVTRQNNNCRFDTQGALTLNPTGGTPPYSFHWSTGATSATINNLPAGPYSYTITDSRGCTRAGSISVLANDPVVANPTVRDVLCYGMPEGGAMLQPSGGVPPYTFAWSNGATSANVDNLMAGTYSYTVTDAVGCTAAGDFAVQQPAPVWSYFTQKYACFGMNDGRAEIFASGGTPPYTYQWSNGATTASINNLAPGMYFYTVTDSRGCQSASGLVCIFNDIVAATATASAPGCEGGDAAITISEGLPPFTYQWSNGSTSSSLVDQPAGNYGYTVTDWGGCSVSGVVNIAAGYAINASVSVLTNGNLQANGSGGVSPYTFVWSNGETGAIASNYSSGSYTVTVTDANGCTDTASGVVAVQSTCVGNITYPGSIGFDQYLCAPGNTPAPIIEVAAPSGGVGDIEYLWMYSTTSGSFNGGFYQPISNSNTPWVVSLSIR